MPTFTPDDHRHMLRALTLARRAQGKVEPNPMVGAVVVKNGIVVGEGFHERFGGNHAEVHALLAAGQNTGGATLYVTLEPCCHWGKTPPCTEAILHTGITRIVVAMIDPFVKVHGNGVKILRDKKIHVDVGLLENEAKKLNAPFITRLTKHRPYIIAKWAQSLDGRVALAPPIIPKKFSAVAKPIWISSKVSREFVQKLRGRMDAIIVGINTAFTDNPLLTARPTVKSHLLRNATRIVIDSQCRLPTNSQLLQTVSIAPLLIAHAQTLTKQAERRRQQLADKGAMTLALSTDQNARPKIPALLKHLADLEYANILLEGGPQLFASFLQQNLIDEAHIFLAPILIGGPSAPSAVGGADIQSIAHAHRLQFTAVKKSGPDLHLVLHRPIPD